MQPVTGLQFEPILERAERESGAFGIIDDGLRGRVGAMVDWINERGPYRPDQIEAMQRQIHKLLVNRLLMALDRRRFPGIAEEKIERPTFIIGFARSGTTLLHSLLAEDPDALALQSWNVLTPSPPPGVGPVASGRMASAQRAIEAWMDFCPGQRPMHPYIDKGAHQLCEDEEMLTLDFRYAYVYYLYEIPTLEGIILSTDQVNAYRFHREALQHFQWNSGKSRWVCKSPAAQHNLDAIFEVYPDARCIWAHRPVSEIVGSIVTLSTVIFDSVAGRAKDPSAFARALAEGMKAAFDRLMTNALIDDPRVMHIAFREISADPMAAIRRIYDWLDLNLTPQLESRVQAWLADPDNRVDRYGRYPYSDEAVGLDPEWVEDLFSEYSRRFGLD